MTFEVTTDVPSSPPISGGRLVGTGAGPTYAPDTFLVDDFLHRAASGHFEPFEFRRDLSTGAFLGIRNNLNGPSVVAGFSAAVGTSNSYVQLFVAENSGAPYRALANGPGVLTTYDNSDVHNWGTTAGVFKASLGTSGLSIAGTNLNVNNLFMQGDGSHAYIRTGNSGFLYLGSDNVNRFVVTSGAFAPVTDNVYSICSAATRSTVVYSMTGAINTSDEREKHWLGEIGPAHIAAAREILAMAGFYQWLTERAAKGEDVARIHFGWRAQAVIRIFMKHGLELQQDLDLQADIFANDNARPTFRHAFLCFDSWDETREPVKELRMVPVEVQTPSAILGPDGKPVSKTTIVEVEQLVDTGETRVTAPAGNRFGFRIDGLLAFLLAAHSADFETYRTATDARFASIEEQLLAA